MIATVSNRLGKIARLPLEIRRRLNERLADNEPGQRLLRWLNSLPEVKEVIKEIFDGRPISQQNLSAWKLGGFRDWERYQETRAQARDFLEEAGELEKEINPSADCCSLLDRLGDRMALVLLQLLREAVAGEKGPPRTREILEIMRELARLRRGDHQRQRAEVVQQRWLNEQEREAQALDEEYLQSKLLDEDAVRTIAPSHRDELIRGLAEGNILPEREQWLRDYFARNEKLLRELGLPGLPEGDALEVEVQAMRESLQATEREEDLTGEEDLAGEDDLDDEEDLADEEDPAGDEEESEGQTRPNKAAQGRTRGEIFSEEAIDAQADRRRYE